MTGVGRKPAILGVVLAGGASRRMGRDKALLQVSGRALLVWAVERLAPQCAALAVSRHDGRLDGLDLVGLPVLADDGPERAGPLAGIVAGLDWAARALPAATHVASVAVDTPFLPADFVARLDAARAAAGADACCASSGGRRHPVAALWPVAGRGLLRAALAGRGLRRVGDGLDLFGPAVATWSTHPVDPFFNVNTPGDAAAAEPLAAMVRLALASTGARTG